ARVALQGILGRPIPGLAAQEERPEVGIVEVEGLGDRVAEVGQGLVGGDFDIAPDGSRLRWRVVATQDTNPEGVDRWLGLPPAWHHVTSWIWSLTTSIVLAVATLGENPHAARQRAGL